VIWALFQDAFWSALAAAGFAVLFNVPPRTLWGCAVTAAVGYSIRTLTIEAFDAGLPNATLIGATAVGFMSVYFARRLRTPTLIFSVTGSIPMVPGLLAFSAMLDIIQLVNTADPEIGKALLLSAVKDAIIVGLTLAAIAVGIIMPKLLFQRVKPIL